MERLSAEYAGQPAIVAAAAGSPVDHVAAYFVQADPIGEDEDPDPRLDKAFADENFELESPWVFVDFWRRLGPCYPVDVSAYEARIRPAPGCVKALSGGAAEL